MNTSSDFHLNYGIIGNCHISALVAYDGSIDWLCLPRFDSPSVFAKILDRNKGGHFSITPDGPFEVSQQYIPNTNVLETLFESDQWAFKIVDFIPRYFEHNHVHYPVEVHRHLIPLRGAAPLRISFAPRFDYALAQPQRCVQGDRIEAWDERQRLFLYSNLSLEMILEEQVQLLSQPAYLVMTYQRALDVDVNAYTYSARNRTITYWQRWVKHCAIPVYYQEETIRSALTLKLHTFEDTGAITAATTTSIPEAIGSERCWDYRFCWLRDSYFVIDALSGLAQFEEMENYILFLKTLCRNGVSELQPVYSITGQANLNEVILTHLEGAGDSKTVRVGNAAYTHKQYDLFGEIVLSLMPMFFDRRLFHPDTQETESNWQLVQALVAAAIETFPLKDSGIWEFRNELRHHTFTKLMIWVTLDRGARIAHHLKHLDIEQQWRHTANQMRDEILAKAWNEELQMFTMAYGGTEADASVLLMPSMGLVEPTDLRFVATVQAYQKILLKNDMMFRYISQDDFGLPESCFNFCTFWMIQALYMIGEEREAKRIFDNMLRCSNHLGLFSEDTNPLTQKPLGNFPQTYTHVGIIQTAKLLSGHRFSYALDYH